MLPEGAAPPRIGELELKVDEALAIARSSEQAVNLIGDAALEAARQAGRAAELAESASAAALEARRAVFERGGGAPEDSGAATPAAAPSVEGEPSVEGSPAEEVRAEHTSPEEPPTKEASAEEVPDPPPAPDPPRPGRPAVSQSHQERLRRFMERADAVAARLRALDRVP